MTRSCSHISWSDAILLVDSMKADNNRLHLLCRIQLLLGLRISDVLALRWCDLFQKELIITEGKTKKQRKMMIVDSLRDDALQEFGIKNNKKKRELIFLNRAGTGAISISYINRVLKKSFKKYGIETDGNISSHLFRKSFCYKILEDGDFSEKSIFQVSRMMNHATLSTTMLYLNLHERDADLIYSSLKL